VVRCGDEHRRHGSIGAPAQQRATLSLPHLRRYCVCRLHICTGTGHICTGTGRASIFGGKMTRGTSFTFGRVRVCF
jgi:hypothetical protein